MSEKIKIASWIAAGALTGVMATVSFQSVARGAVSPLPIDELRQLSAAFGMIKSDYVEPVDEKKLITDAIAGMVSNLDPHSQYYDKKTYREFREGTTGRFVGVGIEIIQEDGLIKIVSPIESSPADRAGLKTGDLITKIDDTAVRGISLNEAVKKMRGKSGTKVVLTIMRRDENNRTFPVTIIREEIQSKSVKSKIVESGYAWIRLSQFQEKTLEDFAAKLRDIYAKEPNLKGLVLDLRNDPGGLLDAAIGVSAAFLPKNSIVVTTNGQLEESRMVYKAAPRDYLSYGANDPINTLPAGLKKVPIVVLVNEGSASASEIVAGALQDYGRATIMGSRTFGKGSVQTIRPLGPDSAIKITTARYYTPKGRSIQAKGVVPDIMVDDTAEGSPYAALRLREADLDKHLDSTAEEKIRQKEQEKEREAALKRLEEESKKPVAEQNRLPEFGSDKDFQLQQALAHLKGLPVKVSKTLTERKISKDESKQDAE